MTDTTPETIRYTADVAVVRGDDILLIERGWDPYKGKLALPGGHVDAGETSRQAAARELYEETGISVYPEELTFIGVWDDPDRDPRGRYVTAVYVLEVHSGAEAQAGDDAVRIEWVPLHEHDQLRGLAFDHFDIVWRVWRREMDRMSLAYERTDELEGLGDVEQVTEAFYSALSALSQLRYGRGDSSDWARAVAALETDILPHLGGIRDAAVRAHAAEQGSVGELARAMGVARSTAQYRREAILGAAPTSWEKWASQGG